MKSPLRMAAKQSPSASPTRALGAWREGGEEEVGARVEQELARVRQAEQPLARDEVPGADPDLVHQERLEVLGDVAVEGKPDDRAPAPLAEQALELAHQVLGLLLDLHVAVAQYPAHARILDPEAGKEAADEGADDLLDGNEPIRIAPELDEPRDPLGNRNEPEHRLLPVVDAAHHEAEPEVGDEGKGMRGIACDGGEDRKDLAHEMLFETRPVGVVDIRLVEHEDSRAAHLGHQRLPAALLIVHQRPRPDRDRGELLGGGHPVLAPGADAGLHLPVQAGNPHHVELVEVGRGDGEEAHALEQGHARVPRFLEHALVEREPGQLAVDEPLGRVHSDSGGRGCGHGEPAPATARGGAKRSSRCEVYYDRKKNSPRAAIRHAPEGRVR